MKFDTMEKVTLNSIGYAVMLAIGLCCKPQKTETTYFQNLVVLAETTSYPVPLWESKASLLSDTMRMCHYKSYVLYDLPNRYVNGKGKVVSGRMYFLNKMGNPYGYKIDSLTEVTIDPTKKVLTDNYLKEIGYGYEHLAATDSLRNAVPAISGDSVRKYIMQRKPPRKATHDTVCLYYSKDINGFDRSLAPQFDTVPGMKLAKIVINFHLNTVDSAKLTLPASRSIQHHLFRTEMDEHYNQRIVSYIEQQSKVIKD